MISRAIAGVSMSKICHSDDRLLAGCFWIVLYTAVMALAAAQILKPWEKVDPIDPEEVPAEVLERGNVATGKRSSRWDDVRDAFVLDNPRCAACGSTERLNVHHVLSFAARPDLELERSNLITLCREHHFRVGHDPDGPWGPAKPNWKLSNPRVREDCERIKILSPR